MKNKGAWYSVVIRIIIFIMLPLALILMMYARINAVLHNYMEIQVAENADFIGKMVSQQISVQLDNLERMAEHFRDDKAEERDMRSAIEFLVEDPAHISCGILKLDGTSVIGENLGISEYPTILGAFRGYSTVSYIEGRGFFLTVPIYNGINIKYVLYEFYDADAMRRSLGTGNYFEQAEIVLADSEQQKAFPISDNIDVSEFYNDELRDIHIGLNRKMGFGTSAAIYYKLNGSRDFWFVSEVGQDNLYIFGRIPYKVAAGRVYSLALMVFSVYMILLVLLAIGTFNVVNANAKARESDALRAAKHMAEEASKSKSTFLANMSHELRTPISVILGMDEMILREETSKDTKERAMDIKSAAQILLSLINDVLDFSKIESGKMNIIPVKYDFVVLIKDLSLLCENRARQKSLNFKIEVQPDLPIGLYGDDIRIRQILINLLTNAVKYTPRGTVSLKITGQRKDEDIVVLHYEVSDTGIGIKQEDINKLMIPYNRIDEEKNRHVEGTGLGLSIIINLLRLMDSKLDLKSVYGEGSAFSFDLEQKIIDNEPVGDIHKRLADMVKDYGYKVSFVAPEASILMVDDNSMNRNIFESLLKSTQIRVTTVSSGKRCLEIVTQEHFDLIFMDYLMPEMDGIETLRRLRTLEGNLCKETPVIALTANAFNGDREMYMGTGFDEFLAKPIVTEKLEALIMKMLPQEYVKTVRVEDSSESGVSENEDEAELAPIEGVNWDFAKLHICELKLLMRSLKDFYDSIPAEYKKITGLLNGIDTEEGLTNYRIQVHSLKSTSAIVGILSVSEMAKYLEKAAGSGEIDKIRTVTPILIDELLKTKEHLKPFVGQNEEEEKEFLEDKSQLLGLFDMLRFSMEQMDIDGADSVMSQIQKYAYESELQEIIDRLKEKVTALSFDEAVTEIDNAVLLLEKG